MAKVVDEASGAWKMVAGNEAETPGWCIPIFIHNGGHHYTPLKVFSDGVVDCWEGLDLPLFREKLTTGWISMDAPPGSRFSTHALGSGTVEAFEAKWQVGDVEERVMSAIRHWNPDLEGLVDLEGQDWELRDGVRWAKLTSWQAMPFRRAAGGKLILGDQVSVFVGTPAAPRLTQWFVYADGTSRLGPGGELMTMAKAEREVRQGRAFCSVADGTWFEVDGLGRAKLSDSFWCTEPEELVKEQRDNLAQLRGEPGAVQGCRDAWKAFQENGSLTNLEALRERYDEVPRHLRMYCGDMDSKDYPIRAALGLVQLPR